MLTPHWLALIWLIDMDFYNNREENCYAIQYNDGLQIMQWSNLTISWISIDSIAKLSPRIQCVSVIVPFGFYRIDCMILSIDWVLSMNHSIDCLSLMIGKYLKNTNHELWLDYHHQSDSDWSILANHCIMIHNTKEINGIQYDLKLKFNVDEKIMNRYRKLTKYTPQNRSVDSTAFLF